MNPAKAFKLELRHVRPTVPKARLTEEADAQAIIAHAQGAMSDVTFFPAFLVLTGVRLGEGAGAHWGDVGAGTFRVQRAVEWLRGGRIEVGEPKTKKSRRTLDLSAGAAPCQDGVSPTAWVRFELTEPFPVRRFSRPLP